jgi:hypothetical protein
MPFILAPNGRWSARDKVGESAIGGFLFTYKNQTRIFKNTYADAGGTVANPNPLQLDSSGTAQIYWEDDEFYTIEVWSVSPSDPTVPFELIYTEDNYPSVTGGSGGDVIINQASPNLVRNAQFTRWGNNNYLSQDNTNDVYSRLGATAANVPPKGNVIADDWLFLRSNTNATVEVSRQRFPLGQLEVPANPINYINYTCTGIGAGGETFKSFDQDWRSVETLSNQEVSVGIYARSITNSNLDVVLQQRFGQGGVPSPTVDTTVISTTLTPAWEQYTGTVTLPSVAGKTLGTDLNDVLRMAIRLPQNATANIDICNVQLHSAPAVPQFAYLPINDQIKRADATSTWATLPTGSIQAGIFNTASDGWVLCDDGTIGSPFSSADRSGTDTLNLFILIWNNIADIYAPIFDSTGTPTTRGASPIDDFNADKRLRLMRSLGRVISGDGAGSGLTTRDLGEYLGEESVSLISANNGPHTHSYTRFSTNDVSQAQSFDTGNIPVFSNSRNTGSSGSGTPHNNMQPTTFATHMIKL